MSIYFFIYEEKTRNHEMFFWDFSRNRILSEIGNKYKFFFYFIYEHIYSKLRCSQFDKLYDYVLMNSA